MVQSQPFSGFRLYADLLPKMHKLGVILAQHLHSQRCSARVALPAELPLKQSSPETNTQPRTPPILQQMCHSYTFSTFPLNNALKAGSLFAEAQTRSKSDRPPREGTMRLLPLSRWEMKAWSHAGGSEEDAALLSEPHEAWPVLMSCPCQIFHQQNCSQVPAHA